MNTKYAQIAFFQNALETFKKMPTYSHLCWIGSSGKRNKPPSWHVCKNILVRCHILQHPNRHVCRMWNDTKVMWNIWKVFPEGCGFMEFNACKICTEWIHWKGYRNLSSNAINGCNPILYNLCEHLNSLWKMEALKLDINLH